MAIEYPAGVHHRYAVLTPLDHPFATVYGVREGPREDQVNVLAVTTEPRASVADDELRFSQMYPQSAAFFPRWMYLVAGLEYDDDDTSSSSGSEEGKEGGGDVSTHDDGSTSHDADTENDDDAPAIANTEDAPMAVEDNGGGKEDSTHQ
mmetsp:Transcript_20082/g.48741  ORF Transcript_20082/g.48741 Transcript_20082/m.48741 type:complete len:149 (+) Transcript_20082:1-447(+)